MSILCANTITTKYLPNLKSNEKNISTLYLDGNNLPYCLQKANVLPEQVDNSKTISRATTLSASQTNVFNVTEKINASIERDRLKNGYYLTDFTATGLYMAPNATLDITVEQTVGTRLPKLLIGTYSRYGTWNAQPTVVQLTAGTNTITNAAGGLLWLRYTNATTGSTAKVTFNNGYQYAPYFKLGVTSNSDWISQLQTYTTPDVVLEGANCVICCIAYQSHPVPERRSGCYTQ